MKLFPYHMNRRSVVLCEQHVEADAQRPQISQFVEQDGYPIAWPGPLPVLLEAFFIDVNDDRNRRGFPPICGQHVVVKSIMKKVGRGRFDKIQKKKKTEIRIP